MKKFLLTSVIAMIALGMTTSYSAHHHKKGAKSRKIGSNCKYKGIKLWGKVKVVNSFPDIKVQVVNSFPDLKVKRVSSFPSSCGKWKFVRSFPDFKVKFVRSFPDIKIKYVRSFPGVR